MSYTLAGPVAHELVIKKSRFVASVAPCADRTSAQAEVARLRTAHPGAAHVCWALMAGGQSAAVDDGEPSGTAGRPMLEVLRHQELEGVLATVVRYFGGVKLGAGGLLRAYTDAVAQALLHAERIPLVRLARLTCEAPYALEGLLRRELEKAGAHLESVRHSDNVQLVFSLPAHQASTLRQHLDDSTSGRLLWPGATG